jgi:hypothetical protein
MTGMHWTDDELFAALNEYERVLLASDLAPVTIKSYVTYAGRFLHWRVGDYLPRGVRPAGRPVPFGPVDVAGLRRDLSAYGTLLDRAGLRPLAVRTYVGEAGRFVAWLAGEYVPGAPRARRSTTRGVAGVRPIAASAAGEMRTPTEAEISAARRRYREVEPRDLFYRAAIDLVGRARDETSSPLSLGEALAVLLFTWNSAYYRYHPATVDHVERLERLLRARSRQLGNWRDLDIRPGPLTRDEADIRDTFSAFETLLGPVGAAKALHLLAPRFFPIWDRTIAGAYGHSLGAAGTNAGRYLGFMRQTAGQCERLRREPGAPVDLVKALDEWNYVTYTRRAG